MKGYVYIRWSTPEQATGDSLRRQTEAAQRYAKAHGIEIQEVIVDGGVSSFKGRHASEGKFARFIAETEAGKHKGDVLLVESVDRLSREEPMIALSRFVAFVNAGLRIVSISENKEYDSNAKLEEIIFLTIQIGRANTESQRKSYLIRKAREARRAASRATGVSFSSKVPAWIKIENNQRVLIPERAKLIEQIFRWLAMGWGSMQICAELERRGIPPWGGPKRRPGESDESRDSRPRHWHKSYIEKLFRNRAIIGEGQPCTGSGWKHQPEGDPIPGYFPLAIPLSLWHEAHDRRKERVANAEARYGKRLEGGPRGPRGRIGAGVANLFPGLLRCGHTREIVSIWDKDGRSYYSHGRVKVDSKAVRPLSWRVSEFEEIALSALLRVDSANLFRDQDKDEAVKAIDNRIAEQRERIEQIKRELANLVEVAANSGSPTLLSGIEARELEQRALEESCRNLRTERRSILAAKANAVEAIQTLREVLSRRQDPEIRPILRDHVARIVDHIDMFFELPPNSTERKLRAQASYARKALQRVKTGKTKELRNLKVLDVLRKVLPRHYRRWAVIVLKDGQQLSTRGFLSGIAGGGQFASSSGGFEMGEITF